MRVVLMIIYSGLLLLFTAGPGFAELDKEEQVKVDSLAVRLNMSTEQKAAVVKEREGSKKVLLRLEGEWQRLHDRLRQEVRSNQPDQAKIDALAESIGKLRGEIISLRTKSLIYLKSVLTPEQVRILEKDH